MKVDEVGTCYHLSPFVSPSLDQVGKPIYLLTPLPLSFFFLQSVEFFFFFAVWFILISSPRVKGAFFFLLTWTTPFAHPPFITLGFLLWFHFTFLFFLLGLFRYSLTSSFFLLLAFPFAVIVVITHLIARSCAYLLIYLTFYFSFFLSFAFLGV